MQTTISFMVSGFVKQDIEITREGLSVAALVAGLESGTYTTTLRGGDDAAIIDIQGQTVALIVETDDNTEFSGFDAD